MGGPGPGGDVFELQQPVSIGQPWTEIILHHFQKADSPHGNIVFDASGAIYGTTNRSNADPHYGYAYKVVVPPIN